MCRQRRFVLARMSCPRLAAKLDLMPVTDIIAILGPDRFDPPHLCRQRHPDRYRQPAKRHILTIRASAFRAAATGNAAPIEALDSNVVASAAKA